MSASPLDAQVRRLLDVTDEEGFRSSHLDGMDVEALEDGRYADVLLFVEAKMEAERYSLLSMLLAGIYFGLVVGFFLMDWSSPTHIALWAVPVALTSLYAFVTFRNIEGRVRRLSEARALLVTLLAHPDVSPDPSGDDMRTPPAGETSATDTASVPDTTSTADADQTSSSSSPDSA